MRTRVPLAAAAATTILLTAAPALAAPPGAEAFDIRYYTSDAEGERSRQMTSLDLEGYVNKARCECGQAVSARVRLNSTTGPVDNVQIRTYVGNQCDIGQLGNNAQARPCALVFDAFTNAYTRNIDVTFNPLWLATGVSRDSPSVGIEDAIAGRDCTTGQGNGGVWICVEDGMQTDCQPEEFVVSGTQNLNTPMGEEAMGIRYDFDPPQNTVSGFKFTGGDGAVEVSWTNDSSGAIDGGFRILCATMDGSPVPGKGYTLPSVTEQNRGSIYFTKDNLCPDGPFGSVEVDPDSSTTGLPDPTGTGTGGTGGGTGGGETGGTFYAFEDDNAPQLGGSNCCGARTNPGCANAGCEAIVCRDMPSCCDEAWTDACATLANERCTTCGSAGDCCSGNGTPGCYDNACENTVCATNASCCKATWSDACATQANEDCSTCMEAGTVTDSTSGSASATGTGTDTDTDTDTDTGGAMLPIESLDWAYVCSPPLPPASASGRIEGLQNGVDYQILVVAYDKAGNPLPVSDVETATPRETTDLWEQCEQQGGVCGKGGFCRCRAGDEPEGAAWLLLLGALGLRRRRAA